MIKLDELKPILEPLLEGREDGVDIIESITAIDKEIEAPDNSEEINRINREWNDRYMKAFFSGVETNNVDNANEGNVEEANEVEEKTTFEDLFKED